jgi:hypothetical protein
MLAATEEIGPLRASGFVAWLLWLAVHPLFLTGFTKGRWRLSHRLAFNVPGLACRSEGEGNLHGGARGRRAVQ